MSLRDLYILREGSPFDNHAAGSPAGSSPAQSSPQSAQQPSTPSSASVGQGDNQEPQDETQEEALLKQILKQDYPKFVQLLGQHIHDKKFHNAVIQMSQEAPVRSQEMDVPVSRLKPTQNEIDRDGSLRYPLTDPGTAEKYLIGGSVAPGGKLIVTGGGGRFIIDGHHRWSQVFLVNPEASIKSLDLSDIKEPMSGLKAAQLGITADTGKLVPQGVKQGNNLIGIDHDSLVQYVTAALKKSPEVLSAFQKHGKGDSPERVAEYIWKNVELMQQRNDPVPGAPPRNLMPQTDDAPEWATDAPNPEKFATEIYRRSVYGRRR